MNFKYLPNKKNNNNKKPSNHRNDIGLYERQKQKTTKAKKCARRQPNETERKENKFFFAVSVKCQQRDDNVTLSFRCVVKANNNNNCCNFIEYFWIFFLLGEDVCSKR